MLPAESRFCEFSAGDGPNEKMSATLVPPGGSVRARPTDREQPAVNAHQGRLSVNAPLRTTMELRVSKKCEGSAKEGGDL